MPSRIIVVTGATGNQGTGVVVALLASDKKHHARALTRDVDSSRAKSFPVYLVSGHAYHQSSLRSAFAGAYGVFAVTSEIYHGKVLVAEAEMAHEIDAGRRNKVLTAKESGVKHFVFSSLPKMDEVTRGRFLGIHHMNNKHAIEMIAKEHLSGVTCLILADSMVEFRTPIPSKQVAQWTDPSYDMGSFAAQVFDPGFDMTAGKTYLVMSPLITPEEMAQMFTRVTGQTAIQNPINPERFCEMTAPFVGPAFKLDAQKMMEWASITPGNKVCFGAMDPSKMNDTFEELGLRATSFEALAKA